MNENQKKLLRVVVVAAIVGGAAWWLFRPGMIKLKDRIKDKFK